MSDTFRWGIVGPGNIAENFAKSIAAVDNAEISAVASRNADRAADFAGRYTIAHTFDNYQKLAEDGNIDAVYIATPASLHYEHIKLFINAGVPVLCEKPFTINQQQTDELFALAKQKNVFLMEAMWTPFLPIYRTVDQWLDEGRIGAIKSMQSSFGFAIARERSQRLLSKELGGGVLLDMGVYNVAISQYLLNKFPQKIQAFGHIGSTGVDEMVSANLDYGDGVCSQFICSFHTRLRNDFTISGEKGEIKVHPMFWFNGAASLTVGDEETVVRKACRAEGFEYEIEHAMACIQRGDIESPLMNHKRTAETMAIMDEIRTQIGMKYDSE